ncbi:fumarate/nitrate reduction transcriptional regulator Fnr [Pseudoduganella ginsengisoli]|uniref:Helix-turn-helix domain-containing protein n=1 Tax=Pseudoduganella ginsengisoli TaxID=1462440 RepID=A0A6L6Q837_9BURK|nr:helix-turn-helix domain-containing protein [Pseudoduganella ginsengisoli]MTW05947.1 helix-turn-helix domain-containing protein [Pseudoduganella ginsengisoli]
MEVETVAPANCAGPMCSQCGMGSFCLAGGLPPCDMQRLENIVGGRRTLMRGEYLFRAGDAFASLFAVRSGYLKTLRHAHGACQVTGFPMDGELLGLDAIADGRHDCDAVALDTCEICEIPFDRLHHLLADVPSLMDQFHRTLSREIQRQQASLFLLGNARAEQRLALFLVGLRARYAARGKPSINIQLRMSREEIGAYLGLTMECVCRLLARFRKAGWITLTGRRLTFIDGASLAAVAEGVCYEALG